MASDQNPSYKRAMSKARREERRAHDKSVTDGAKCGARKRSGPGTCQMPAGMGTSHYGFGRCKWHGGALDAGKLNAAKQEAIFMGAPKEINPVEAITWCIHITAGEIEWFSARMAELEKEDWFEQNILGKQLNILGRERANAIVRLEKFAKDAIALGIAERRVRIAEQYGAALARLLRGVMEDLQLTPQQKERAPAIIRKHLILLEGRAPDMSKAPAAIEGVAKRTGAAA